MDYVCTKRGQVRIDKKIHSVSRGQVLNDSQCEGLDKHPCFRAITGPVDFANASEEELMAAKWTFEEAAEALKRLYSFDLVKNNDEPTKKTDLVKEIIDVRYRALGVNTTKE